MIRRLFALNLQALLSGNPKGRSGGKKSGGGKKSLVVAVGVLLAVSLFGVFMTFFWSMLAPFFTTGIGWMYFAVLALIVFALNVVSTIFSASALIFGARDNDLLLSLPVRPSVVLISRLLVLLASEYLFALVVALAAFIPWALGGYATVVGVVYFVIEVLLLPLPALAVSLLLAWLLGLITSRLRRKNIITIAVSLGFLFAYFYFCFNMQWYMQELIMRGEEIAAAFHRAMPPFYAFGRGIADAAAGGALQFFLWAALPFAAAVYLLSANYRRILTTNRGTARIAYKERKAKSKSILSALVRKEMAHYLNRPMIILNCSFGAVFMVIGAAALLVKGDELLSTVADVLFVLGGLSGASLCTVVLIFLAALNNLSASLISLEGSNLWIAQSLPAPGLAILTSKVCAHLVVTALPCLLASIGIGIAVAENLSDWLVVLIVPQTFIALTAAGGLAVNLHFPKLDWTNEARVVKQGLSAMITLFGTALALIVLGLLYGIVLSGVISLAVYLWICAVIFAAGAAVVYAWLIRAGSRKFAAL
jgi:ABC-2 type transport system permease protein